MIPDRDGKPLEVGDLALLHYRDGSDGEAEVVGFDPGAEDGNEVELALDGGVRNHYPAESVEFVERPAL